MPLFSSIQKRARTTRTSLRSSSRFSSTASSTIDKYTLPEVPDGVSWNPPVPINNELARQDDETYLFSVHPSLEVHPTEPFTLLNQFHDLTEKIHPFDTEAKVFIIKNNAYVPDSDILPTEVDETNINSYVPLHEKLDYKYMSLSRFVFGIRTKNERLGGYIHNWLTSDTSTNHKCKVSPIIAVKLATICGFENTSSASINPSNFCNYIQTQFGLQHITFHPYDRGFYLKVKNGKDLQTRITVLDCADIHRSEATESILENEDVQFDSNYQHVAPVPLILYANDKAHAELFEDQKDFVDNYGHITVSLPDDLEPANEDILINRLLQEYENLHPIVTVADKIDDNWVFTCHPLFIPKFKTLFKSISNELGISSNIHDRQSKEVNNNFWHRRVQKKIAPSLRSTRSTTSATSSVTQISRPFGKRKTSSPPASISIPSGVQQSQVQKMIENKFSEFKESQVAEKTIVTESGENISNLIDERIAPLKIDLATTKTQLKSTITKQNEIEKLTNELNSNQQLLNATVENARKENEKHRAGLKPFLNSLRNDVKKTQQDIKNNYAKHNNDISNLKTQADATNKNVKNLEINFDDFLAQMNDNLEKSINLKPIDMSRLNNLNDESTEKQPDNSMDLDTDPLTQNDSSSESESHSHN